MSVQFTTPAGAAWQTLLDELTLAWSERRQALGQSAYTPADGNDVSRATYWQTLQSWLENNCTSFVDHVNGPLNGAGDGLLYYTLETWRAAAGLNGNGFRRKIEEDGGYAYGIMQAGTPADIIDCWIFEDLQKGFGALRWTSKQFRFGGGPGYIYDPVVWKEASVEGYLSKEACYAALAAKWEAESWHTFSAPGAMRDRAWIVIYRDGDKIAGQAVRERNRILFYDLSTVVPRAVEIWSQECIGAEDIYQELEHKFSPHGDYASLDFHLIASFQESTAASFYVDYLSSEDFPDMPELDTLAGWGIKEVDEAYSAWRYALIKWNFTNI
jgi:hypothetical protein